MDDTGVIERLPSRGILESLADAVIVADAAGDIVFANAATESLLGWLPSSLVGKPLTVLMPERMRSGHDVGFRRLMTTHQPRHAGESIRLPALRKDGSELEVELTLAQFVVDGRDFVVGSIRELRDRVELERQTALSARLTVTAAEAKRSRDLLSTILGAVSEGITAQDGNGKLLFANQAAARLSGFASATDMLAQDPLSIVARFDLTDDKGRALDVDGLPGRAALRGESPRDVLVRSRNRATGEVQWYSISATAVPDEHGVPAIAVNVFREVTQARTAEGDWRFLVGASAALASSLEYEKTLATVVALAVPEVADWCAVEIAEPGEQPEQVALAHVDPSKITLAKELRRRWPPKPDDPNNGVARVMRTGKPELWPEIPLQMLLDSARDEDHLRILRDLGLRSAMVAPLIVRGQPRGVITFVAAESGRIFGERELALAVEIARRASVAIENALLYREAQEAARLREAFLAVAAHELRTPLQVLGLTSQSLEKSAANASGGTLDADAVAKKSSRLTGYVRRLEKLVERLLEVPRLASGQFELEREQLDLTALARELIDEHADVAAKAGCQLMVESSGPVVGCWDRLRIEAVLTNLLTNAIKYGGGGPVRFRIGIDGDQARVAVEDQGIGFEARDQERLFGRFVRLVGSRNFSGLGIGLWIVREIVRAHGGEITASSPGIGKGATFELTLPLTPPASAPAS